jgi:Single-strand binding protein family
VTASFVIWTCPKGQLFSSPQPVVISIPCYLSLQKENSLMYANKVIHVGRLGRGPETSYTGGGQAGTNFSIATDGASLP